MLQETIDTELKRVAVEADLRHSAVVPAPHLFILGDTFGGEVFGQDFVWQPWLNGVQQPPLRLCGISYPPRSTPVYLYDQPWARYGGRLGRVNQDVTCTDIVNVTTGQSAGTTWANNFKDTINAVTPIVSNFSDGSSRQRRKACEHACRSLKQIDHTTVSRPTTGRTALRYLAPNCQVYLLA